ncbi:ferritin-like domain-containing protein [Agrobacterium sp. SORGH_AS 787]|uniref:ferritin-like domain-containing protein n=1 Tax=Agrobacterium sp. SORGH_AS 787 TaxID=3041775 RepID=UPI00278747F2|nr:ferritin-like metal-binding protein YciE [Rhizobium sp. SORGH_AS_0787]
MTTDIRDIFVTGLRNAHAMENQALSIIKPQIQRIENYPEVRERLEMHLHETERQISRLDEILAGLSENASSLKDTAMSFTGAIASLGHAVAGDEIVKNSLANFAFEHYEIAAYKSLLAIADHGGFTAARSRLDDNLEEEIQMAVWLESNLQKITLEFVALRERGGAAKV